MGFLVVAGFPSLRIMLYQLTVTCQTASTSCMVGASDVGLFPLRLKLKKTMTLS